MTFELGVYSFGNTPYTADGAPVASSRFPRRPLSGEGRLPQPGPSLSVMA
jgi:hypothetical protein